MKKLLLVSAFFLMGWYSITISGCNTPVNENPVKTENEDQILITVDSLKKYKSLVDTLLLRSNRKMVVFEKQYGFELPRQVYNAKFSDSIETTYNMLLDSEGKILVAFEVPYSETGDWTIILAHYFNAEQKTVAFERVTNFYNSECTGDMAFENLVEYYDSVFAKIGNTYKLTDINGTPLIKDSCEFPYEYNYNVIQDVKSYITQKKIPFDTQN